MNGGGIYTALCVTHFYLAFQPFSAAGTVASASTQGSADGRQLCRRGEKAARLVAALLPPHRFAR